MTDYLIMLLSTDWFLPYWAEIGIIIDETKKSRIQRGCREIVIHMLGVSDSYFLGDVSEERKQVTRSRFLSLLRNCEAESEVLEAYLEWDSLSHQELAAAWTCSNLNRKMAMDDISGGGELDPRIRAEVIQSSSIHALNPSEYRDVCLKSKSNWDNYSQSIADKPHFLSNQLWRVLLHHRLREIWEDIRQKLTPQQLDELILWYRAMNKYMLHEDRSDLIPSYMG
jgi:hypothetical protein